MYKIHFGLKKDPFNMTPDPKYIYLSDLHEDALMQLMYGINTKKGFILLTGEVGTGKTTICRTLLEKLDDNTETALLLNPYLNDKELLKSILDDFGIACESDSIKDMIDALNAFLLQLKKEEKNAALIIDEAQNLPLKSMELIRMLSNLETDTEKLLQIVLLGQPELKYKLSGDKLRQLNQRIMIRAKLGPLNIKDTKGYISHRLSKAGALNGDIFTSSAAREVFHYTKGYPRLINSLCDRALLCAYSFDKRTVDNKIVSKAAVDVIENLYVKRGANYYKFGFFALTFIFFFTLLTPALIDYLSSNNSSARHAIVKKNAVISNSNELTQKSGSNKNVIFKGENGRYLTNDLSFSLEVSVMNVLTIWQEDTDVLNIMQNFDEPSTTLEYLLDKLTSYGIYLKPKYNILNKRASLKKLKKLNMPAIVAVRDERKANSFNYSLAIAYGNYGVKLIDPQEGVKKVSPAEFKRMYMKDVIIMYKSPFVSKKTLKKGITTEDVVILEESLKELGYFEDVPDNKFDERTHAAVKSFQEDKRLTPDGHVGMETKLALIKEMNGLF
jgi:general secretion pathway protein A